MAERTMTENIIRRRMHGLYLSRQCADLEKLAHELLGLHSWFYRNVPFSALIRGADISGWKTRLTKTWLIAEHFTAWYTKICRNCSR